MRQFLLSEEPLYRSRVNSAHTVKWFPGGLALEAHRLGINQLKSQGPSRNRNESKEEEDTVEVRVWIGLHVDHPPTDAPRFQGNCS
jgi:hypothetical protein